MSRSPTDIGTAPLLAVVTAAALKHPLRDARMAEFVDGIERVNLLAAQSPGFVWRHRGPAGHAAVIDAFGHTDVLLNVSLWRDYPSLHAFIYRGLHGRYVTARERWFDPLPGPTTALWWVPPEQRPTPAQALGRLLLLRREGPSARAFTALRRWRPDGTPEPPHRRRSDARRSPNDAASG